MEVVALIGPPGTGKSDRALVVAYENHASCIIDDGILIYRNRLVAGASAKKEASKVAAVRRAIFQDPKQVQDVKTALARIRPERILVLGTSDRMVIRITAALDLPEPTKYVHIDPVDQSLLSHNRCQVLDHYRHQQYLLLGHLCEQSLEHFRHL